MLVKDVNNWVGLSPCCTPSIVDSLESNMRDSLEKVFAVLEEVASSDGPVTLKAVSGTTGYHPSTVSRILANLLEIGYVRKENYREFSLDLGLIPLGQKALSHFPLPRIANPLIRKAANGLKVAGALAGLHKGRLVYLYRSRVQDDPDPLMEDYRFPLHRSNCAIVLLAGSDDAEARRLLSASVSGECGGKTVPRKLLDALMKRVRGVRSSGYSYVVEEDAWNVAFPISYRGRSFAVSLHEEGLAPKKPEKVILECSLLARRIETDVRGVTYSRADSIDC